MIRKLGLSFGSFENRRHYSSVPFNYGKNKEIPTEKSTQPRTSKPSTQLLTAQGKVILNLLDEGAMLVNIPKLEFTNDAHTAPVSRPMLSCLLTKAFVSQHGTGNAPHKILSE